MRKTGLVAALSAPLLCASLTAPALAADGGMPEIMWLSTAGQPLYYNKELGWLTLSVYDSDTGTYTNPRIINLATGELLDFAAVGPFFDGLASAVKCNADGYLKWGFVDKTGAVVIPLEYDIVRSFSDGLAVVAKKDADGNKSFPWRPLRRV